MPKILKYFLYFTGGIILLFLFALAIPPHFPRRHAGVLAAVMVDNELYFIMDKKYGIGLLQVNGEKNADSGSGEDFIPMWWIQRKGDSKPPKLRQVKYGQNPEGLTLQEGPKTLEQNVEYGVHIRAGGMMPAGATFIIKDAGTVIMPEPSNSNFNSLKVENRTVTIEKNGKKTVIPFTIVPNPGGGAVITSGSVQENKNGPDSQH